MALRKLAQERKLEIPGLNRQQVYIIPGGSEARVFAQRAQNDSILHDVGMSPPHFGCLRAFPLECTTMIAAVVTLPRDDTLKILSLRTLSACPSSFRVSRGSNLNCNMNPFLNNDCDKNNGVPAGSFSCMGKQDISTLQY